MIPQLHKKTDFLRLWIPATSRASQRKLSVSNVMKCGVIFYFVSLDSLEITHSILKHAIFQLSKMRHLLASGQEIYFRAAVPPARFLGFVGCFNLQLIIQIHFEMQGYILSGLFKRQKQFFFPLPPQLMASKPPPLD